LTLCIYLLQMREFYRWQQGLPFGATLPRAELGEWIAAQEARWDVIEAREYGPIPVPGGAALDPFDAPAVNAALRAHGLLYGAGRLSGSGAQRPVFFLAEAAGSTRREGIDVLQAGREWARGLASPPAVLAGGGEGPIVIRRESLARWGWQGYESYRLRPADSSAWQAVVQAYGLDQGFDAGLPRWLDDQVEIATLHELGEFGEARRRGDAWHRLRRQLRTRRGLLHAVALRDHLADLQSTLPALLERAEAAPLHAWFSSFDGLRAELFPCLVAAYRRWREGAGLQTVAAAVTRGRDHFEARAEHCFRLLGSGADGDTLEGALSGPAAACAPPPV
jgi:hypothetical protein